MKPTTHKPTDEMTEDELYTNLAALIMALAERGIFLVHTDHLSDSALYLRLGEAIARGTFEEPTGDWQREPDPEWSMLMDLSADRGIGALDLFLRHYADEEERAWWSRHRPVPPHEDPPFDRDRTLPRPESPLGSC